MAILIVEPADAAAVGLAFPGAFHLYTLAIYSDDAPYFASLRSADIPIEFVPELTYERQIDDVTGLGHLVVHIPAKGSSVHTFNTAFGYGMPTGPLHAIFWHDSHHGRTAFTSTCPSFGKRTLSATCSHNLAARWTIC